MRATSLVLLAAYVVAAAALPTNVKKGLVVDIDQEPPPWKRINPDVDQDAPPWKRVVVPDPEIDQEPPPWKRTPA
ncbi:hypothetical protein C8R43DRAFT_1236604 [Mycena crocata]|nr:hypothetical protein C8R43DRAFT_1236604 [Mycena crocata]